MERNMVLPFAKYAALNVVGMLGLSCYILADTYFISKGLGADGLTALNLAIPVYSFVHGSGLMVGMGGATQYSLAGGKNGGEQAKAIFTKALWYSGLLAGICFFIGLFLAGRLSALLGADAAVYEMTTTYLRVILLFAPAFLTNETVLCFVRNDGSPKLAMAGMLGGSFSNIILDYIFIFPLNMGMFGAALATGFAPIISLAILSPHFRRRDCGLRPVHVGLDLRAMGEIGALGAPSLITEVSSGVVMIVFNLVILSLEGNLGVAAYGVIANLSLVVTSLFTGLGQGIQPLISASCGSGRKEDAAKVYRCALVSALGFFVLVYAATYFLADSIAGAFNQAGNPVLQAIAVQGLRLYFTAFLFAGFNVVTAVYFSSVDRPGPGFLVSILRGFVLVLPLTFLMARLWGMTGVWLTFPAAEALTAAVTGALLAGMSRKEESKNA